MKATKLFLMGVLASLAAAAGVAPGASAVFAGDPAKRMNHPTALTGPPTSLHQEDALGRAVEKNDPEAVRKALDSLRAAGRSLPKADRNGRTVLHEAAAWCGGPSAGEIARLLLDAGADPNAATADGATPVHFAAGRADAGPVIALLLARGGRVDAPDAAGRTPLHGANGEATAKALLAAGADPHARDADGFTPLHAAAYGADDGQARALLAAGADVNARTTRDHFLRPPGTPKAFADDPTDDVPAGDTPLDIARRKHDAKKWVTGKYRNVVEVLEEAGGRTNNVRVFPWRLVFGVTALVLLAGCAGLVTLAVRIVRRW